MIDIKPVRSRRWYVVATWDYVKNAVTYDIRIGELQESRIYEQKLQLARRMRNISGVAVCVLLLLVALVVLFVTLITGDKPPQSVMTFEVVVIIVGAIGVVLQLWYGLRPALHTIRHLKKASPPKA
jgi:multisubunit Na+/H+ antiporter MnhF subunit